MAKTSASKKNLVSHIWCLILASRQAMASKRIGGIMAAATRSGVAAAAAASAASARQHG